MGSKTKKLEDILNAGIGAVKTSQEVWDKLVTDLNTRKEELTQAFQKLKEEGEKDFSDSALKIKVGAAWSIVRFEEIKDNILNFLNQNNPSQNMTQEGIASKDTQKEEQKASASGKKKKKPKNS